MAKILTLVIVHDNEKILLGMKKRGFGSGRWNGFGGKVEPGETLEQAAHRELEEEAGVRAIYLKNRGQLLFTFADGNVDMEVNIFSTDSIEGNPMETEEMLPQWFSHAEIPYPDMWADDQYWLPLLLEGKNITGKVDFENARDQVIINNTIQEYVSEAY